MEKQTFDSIRWLASEVLLRHGALDRLLNDGVEEFMQDCPYDDLTADQVATAEAVLDDDAAISALFDYWAAYDAGREAGDIPAVRSPWLN